MAKIVFTSGQELPVSFFGLSSMGILYIDCSLSLAEALALFGDRENTGRFSYVTEEETAPHSFEEKVTPVTGFQDLMGVQKLCNGLTEGSQAVRVTLMRGAEGV